MVRLLASLRSSIISFMMVAGTKLGRNERGGNPSEPESEVCTIDQHAAYVRRLSMTPIIASLANPTAIHG
jgi:hypothetical protein